MLPRRTSRSRSTADPQTSPRPEDSREEDKRRIRPKRNNHGEQDAADDPSKSRESSHSSNGASERHSHRQLRNHNNSDSNDDSSEKTGSSRNKVVEEDEIDSTADTDNTKEVTRCICGHEEILASNLQGRDDVDTSLFIQCDKCGVWQHGFCVGLESADLVPDVYFCERCRPDFHIIVVRPNGKTSKYTPHPNDPEEKLEVEQRDPENDEKLIDAEVMEDTAESHKDFVRELKSASAEEKPDSRKKSSSSSHVTTSTPEPDDAKAIATRAAWNRREESRREGQRRRTLNSSRDAAYEETLKRVLEESVHDDDRHSSPTSDSRVEDALDIRKESNGAERTAETDTEAKVHVRRSAAGTPALETSESSDTKAKGKSRKRPAASELVQETEGTEVAGESHESSANTPKRKRNRTSAKTSKPKQSSDNSNSQNHRDEISVDKPSKPRIPQPRSSLAEMRKRVAAILEFIGRTQLDMATEQKDRKMLMAHRVTVIQAQLSRSAIDDDKHMDANLEALLDAYKPSFDLMDALTHKLLIWEQQFGRYGQS